MIGYPEYSARSGSRAAELLLVVRHVAATVDVERNERRVGDEPAADPVVDRPVGEQQPVRRLVAQDREPSHRPAHQREGDQPADGVAPPRGQHEHADGLDPQPGHVRTAFADVRDAVELVAQLADRSTSRAQPVGGQDVVQPRRIGQHRRGVTLNRAHRR